MNHDGCPSISLLLQLPANNVTNKNQTDQQVQIAQHVNSCEHCKSIRNKLQDTESVLLAPLNRTVQRDMNRLERIKQRIKSNLEAAQPFVDSVTTPLKYVGIVGKGGLGEVHEFFDTLLQRPLAVKVVRKSLADNVPILARFERERRITSSLSHPGIIPVLGAGSIEDGRPYYVMTLVKGRSLSEHIRQVHNSNDRRGANLDSARIRMLLDLFRQICETLSYAHEKNVLHRDLKPGNIIVANTGQAVVLDWGLAKVIGDTDLLIDETEAGGDTNLTHVNDRFGSPAYMSPEQARGETHKIDRRTDIYCLGAILFEIITARPPHRFDDNLPIDSRLKRHLLYERIAANPTPKTSTVNPSAPRELVSVCAKAMSGEREDRYQTVNEMIEDLDRFSLDNVVLAHQYSFAERVKRWIRRHPEFAIASVIFLIPALGALFVTNHFRMAAKESALLQTSALLKARETVESLLTRTGESLLLNQPNAQRLRKQLLETALKYETEFLAEQGANTELAIEVADARIRVGRLRQMLGDTDAAKQEYAQAEKELRILMKQNRSGNEVRSRLSYALMNRAEIFYHSNRTAEARSAFTEAAQLANEAANGTNPTEASKLQRVNTRIWLARIAWESGDIKTGQTYENLALEAAEQLDPQRPRSHDKLAIVQSNIGVNRRDSGDIPGSLQMLLSALQSAKRAITIAPDDITFLARLGSVQYRLYLTCLKAGEPDQAENYLSKAHEIRTTLARQNPNVVQFISDCASTCNELGVFFMKRGALDQATKHFAESIEAHTTLTKLNPANSTYKSELAGSLNNRAATWLRKKNVQLALKDFERARRLLIEIVNASPDRLKFKAFLGTILFNIATLHSLNRDYEKSFQILEAALVHQSELCSARPDATEYVYDFAKSTRLKGELLFKKGIINQAVVAFEKYLQQTANVDGEHKAAVRKTRNHALHRLCQAYRKLDQPTKAIRAAHEKRLLNPKNPIELYNVACELSLCVDLFGPSTTERKQTEADALTALREAVALHLFEQPGMRDHIQKDADLESIRTLPEFQRIVSSD